MSHQVLLEKLDQSLELLSLKLAELIKLSAIENVETQDDDEQEQGDNTDNMQSDLTVATSGLSMVYSHTQQMIKATQDLLSLTRSIREIWILNQIPSKSLESNTASQEIDYEKVGQLLDRAMEMIVN